MTRRRRKHLLILLWRFAGLPRLCEWGHQFLLVWRNFRNEWTGRRGSQQGVSLSDCGAEKCLFLRSFRCCPRYAFFLSSHLLTLLFKDDWCGRCAKKVEILPRFFRACVFFSVCVNALKNVNNGNVRRARVRWVSSIIGPCVLSLTSDTRVFFANKGHYPVPQSNCEFKLALWVTLSWRLRMPQVSLFAQVINKDPCHRTSRLAISPTRCHIWLHFRPIICLFYENKSGTNFFATKMVGKIMSFLAD